MIILGLTGPTGAGKTTACDTFRELGAIIINADLCAREVTRKGCPALSVLAEEFGSDILVQGELDRRELARRAFADEQKTQRLNQILLPFIVEYIAELLKVEEARGSKAVVLDAPTLFESGCDALCNVTVALLSERESRFQRILERDDISEADALLRLNAGKDDEFYKSRADYILYNNGSEEELSAAAKELFYSINK